MNIVITGATSMIGCAILDEFLNDPHIETVFLVIRDDTIRISRLPQSSKIVIVKCDIGNYRSLPFLIHKQCDVFYHIAWGATGKGRNDNIFKQINNIGYTLDALYAAKELGCSKFIGAGSQAEYGVLNTEKIGPNSNVNPIQPYGIAKYAAGKIAMEESKKIGICCIWVRIFSVYGVYDKPTTMISSTIKKMINNERIALTKGEQLWDYLYSGDAGKALYLIGVSEKTENKVYCLGSGQCNRIIDYVSVMKAVTNSKSELGFGEMTYGDNCIMRLCADISELTKDTGWKPTVSFEQGIRIVYDYYITNGEQNVL